ncbi:Uncharacterized protein TCM_032663 [Theobroma cacao]|uniref:Uncharacterized protein n=1 Tax=Theobroma cacao TaxID=3641 RepID=A0A061FAH2_THECC|nr:Uncharacterized protein TCM_032663 [Theobroma cacao]
MGCFLCFSLGVLTLENVDFHIRNRFVLQSSLNYMILMLCVELMDVVPGAMIDLDCSIAHNLVFKLFFLFDLFLSLCGVSGFLFFSLVAFVLLVNPVSLDWIVCIHGREKNIWRKFGILQEM